MDIGTILSTNFNIIFSLVFMAIWITVIFGGQRIQVSSMINKIESELLKLKIKRNRFKLEGYKLFMTDNPALDIIITTILNEAVEHYTILPSDLDPKDLVPKIKHIFMMRDEYYEKIVSKLCPMKSKQERRNLESVIQVMSEVEFLYKTARHYYFLAKRTGDAMWAFQSGMIIQEVKQFFELLKNTILCIATGIPIGDGAGPMVAENLGRGCKWKLVAFDTVMTETTIEDRRTYIIKAQGAGSTVGRVSDALADLIRDIDVVIMVDACSKTEGDMSGEVIMGEGAAIGGLGVEKFEIEEMVVKRKIPLYAILVKESFGEAVGPMTEAISSAIAIAVSRVRELIKSFDKDSSVVVIGVGNTGGISQ